MSEKVTLKKDDIYGCVLFLLLPLLMVAWGAVLKCYFIWFFTPAFGVPTPSLALCCGIHWAIRVITFVKSGKRETNEERVESALAYLLAGFGVAWIIHLFV